MLLANPKINGSVTTVPTILNAIPRTKPAMLPVKGGIPIPPWEGFDYHYQGIAPYNGDSSAPLANGCISASSTSGYFSGFSQDPSADNATVKSVIVPQPGYYHLAGIQMLGELLPVPLESESKSVNALVEFYNVGNLSAPTLMYSLTMPARKASAVGITTYTDANHIEQCMLVVYQYDDRQMYIYQAPASGLAGPSCPFTYKGTYSGDALKGDQYQNFALVTQTDSSGDVVYLLGFREDEELHLFTVNTTPGSSYGTPTAVATYTGWSGADWRNGAGLQICNSTKMRLFGTDKDPSGSSANYTFNVFAWG